MAPGPALPYGSAGPSTASVVQEPVGSGLQFLGKQLLDARASIQVVSSALFHVLRGPPVHFNGSRSARGRRPSQFAGIHYLYPNFLRNSGLPRLSASPVNTLSEVLAPDIARFHCSTMYRVTPQ